MDNEKIRLQKFLSQCGIASRRKAEELIVGGHVKVNGQIASLGDKINPKKDKILCRGKRVSNTEKLKYVALYKPRGYLSAVSDERGVKCVTELVSDLKEHLYPVGRLDKNSEGLLLMTNDGEFANSITHPSKHIPKVYRVTINGKINKYQLDTLNSSMEIDGKMTIPAKVYVIKAETDDRTVLEFELYQGINRQIRKMCDAVGLDVKRLKRVSVGDITIQNIRPGKYRFLEKKEIESFFKE